MCTYKNYRTDQNV